MNIIHFINALENGGAEKIMYETILGLNDSFNHRVVTISKRGIYLHKLIENGIRVEVLSFRVLSKFLLGSRKDTVIHSYLYRSHALSGLFKFMGYSVIWSIHGSFPKKANPLKKIVGLLSLFVPDKITFVSKCSLEKHINAGYSAKKSMVIYNGLDINKFSGNKTCTLDLSSQSFVNICMVSRFHHIKDYPRFFSIASSLIKLHPKTRFYLIGKGNHADNHALVNLLHQYNLMQSVTLLGEFSDISQIYPCFDLLVSTSKSESFGLTIMEAILSGVNVSTINLPVMDELLGEYSTNEGNNKDGDLALCWLKKAGISPSQSSKEFIMNRYSLDAMLLSFSTLYKSFLR